MAGPSGTPLGAQNDEVLYADDTIIFSTDNITIEKLLHKIENCAKPYGLKLNHAKCEVVCTDPKHKNKSKAHIYEFYKPTFYLKLLKL